MSTWSLWNTDIARSLSRPLKNSTKHCSLCCRKIHLHPCSPYKIVIINAPLPDDFGTSLALDACSDSGAGVLLLVKAEHFPDVNARVGPHGVLTLAKPLSQVILTQSLQLLCGTRQRLRRMEQKTASLEEKMQEIRMVNHAKWLLIEQLKMTEQQAHRYIEKQAMDRCVTKRTVAESILATYK